MSAEVPPTTSTTTNSGADFSEDPGVVCFTATEFFAPPQPIIWIEVLFCLVAMVCALAIFKRERSWSAALMALAFCCISFSWVPTVIALLCQTSEVAMRISRMLTYSTLYAQFLGSALLASSLFLYWRQSRPKPLPR
jgi:hypothetical protein